jgi:hypothetical protein
MKVLILRAENLTSKGNYRKGCEQEIEQQDEGVLV